MADHPPYCVPFEECDRAGIDLVGGKNASIGELIAADAPVPPGFAVTTAFYAALLDHNDLDGFVRERLSGIDPDDDESVRRASDDLREAIRGAELSPAMEEALSTAWAALAERCVGEELRVAVRSSATAEDLPEASFAGQHDTYLNVRGEGDLRDRVRECMASLFTPRAIAYREATGVEHADVAISVGVQELVRPRSSGVMFTLNPANGDRSKVAIEGNWGFGEAVVEGDVTPDSFLVDKPTFEVVERTISTKTTMTALAADGVADVAVEDGRRDEPCLTDEEIEALAELGKRIEREFGAPQDVEWVIAEPGGPENILVVQSRPETAWNGG